MNKLILMLGLLFGVTLSAHATLITFDDTDLAGGASISKDGLTITTTTDTGDISTISSGSFAGLWLGSTNSSGNYTLSFSQAISSIEIEFDAFSSIGRAPVETLFNFMTNNGGALIGYLNQFGTLFDGATITSTANDGQGIITFSGIDFTSFSFDHAQGLQSGFVIERIVVNTDPAGPVSNVSAPSVPSILALGFVVMFVRYRRSR